jgi:hypothetical protein
MPIDLTVLGAVVATVAAVAGTLMSLFAGRGTSLAVPKDAIGERTGAQSPEEAAGFSESRQIAFDETKSLDRTQLQIISKHLGRAPEKASAEAETKPEDEVRLPDVKAAWRRQRSKARWSGWANMLLTVSQVVVGGALATTFTQQSITPGLAGFIGLLVLVSSLLRQILRLDQRETLARRRAAKLYALVLELQDGLYAVDKGHSKPPSLYSLRKKASAGLASDELEEVSEPAVAPVP